MFRAFSVFAGGATLDAVEAVADAGTDVPTALEALLDSGLVTHEAPEGEPRFGMLETIREFAAVQLREEGEESAARDRHLDHNVAFAETAELRSREGVTPELLEDIEVERDNLRAALIQAAGEGDPERQLRLVTSLRIFLKVRGPAAEDRRMVADALARRNGASPGQQGRILISAGIHAVHDDDGERALECFDEARELLVAADDVRGAALADANASTALSRLGREDEAMQRSELAREGFHAVGAVVAESQVIANLARHYEHAGDFATARAYLVEALELQARGGFPEARAFTLAMLGYLSEREGDLHPPPRNGRPTPSTVAGDLQKDEYLGYALLFAADLVQRRGDQDAGRTPARRVDRRVRAGDGRPAGRGGGARRAGARRPRGARTGRGGRRRARPRPLGRARRHLTRSRSAHPLEVVLADVAGDLLSEHRSLFVGVPEVDPAPDAGVDDLLERVREALEVARLAREAAAEDVEPHPVGAEEVLERVHDRRR